MIKVNQEKCIGCGVCESLCPKVFKLSETQPAKSQVISQDIAECDIQNCIDSCPVEAISNQ